MQDENSLVAKEVFSFLKPPWKTSNSSSIASNSSSGATSAHQQYQSQNTTSSSNMLDQLHMSSFDQTANALNKFGLRRWLCDASRNCICSGHENGGSGATSLNLGEDSFIEDHVDHSLIEVDERTLDYPFASYLVASTGFYCGGNRNSASTSSLGKNDPGRADVHQLLEEKFLNDFLPLIANKYRCLSFLVCADGSDSSTTGDHEAGAGGEPVAAELPSSAMKNKTLDDHAGYSVHISPTLKISILAILGKLAQVEEKQDRGRNKFPLTVVLLNGVNHSSQHLLARTSRNTSPAPASLAAYLEKMSLPSPVFRVMHSAGSAAPASSSASSGQQQRSKNYLVPETPMQLLRTGTKIAIEIKEGACPSFPAAWKNCRPPPEVNVESSSEAAQDVGGAAGGGQHLRAGSTSSRAHDLAGSGGGGAGANEEEEVRHFFAPIVLRSGNGNDPSEDFYDDSEDGDGFSSDDLNFPEDKMHHYHWPCLQLHGEGCNGAAGDANRIIPASVDVCNLWASGIQRVCCPPPTGVFSTSINTLTKNYINPPKPEHILFENNGFQLQDLPQLRPWHVCIRPLLLERAFCVGEKLPGAQMQNQASADDGFRDVLRSITDDTTTVGVGGDSASTSTSSGGANDNSCYNSASSHSFTTGTAASRTLTSSPTSIDKRQVFFTAKLESFARKRGPSYFGKMEFETSANLFQADVNISAIRKDVEMINQAGTTASVATPATAASGQYTNTSSATGGASTNSANQHTGRTSSSATSSRTASRAAGPGGQQRRPQFVQARHPNGQQQSKSNFTNDEWLNSELLQQIRFKCPHPESGLLTLKLNHVDAVTRKISTVSHYAMRLLHLRPGLRWVPFAGNREFRGMLVHVEFL
ncbi:unnamed protein product [Amoebophrya sp. A120]|nr:unnamed protein product [Amoebophrya sp. A120]|eukprot:GSA120T00010092001.1